MYLADKSTMRVVITLLVGALAVHYARGHGQMYNPTPWQATSDCSSQSPFDCHWDLTVDTTCNLGSPQGDGNGCHGYVVNESRPKLQIRENSFSTNWTMVPGQEATLPEEMFDAWVPEWERKTWFGPGEFGLNPWNSPGSAPIYGNGCGVDGGNPDGCTGGGEVLGQCCGKPGTGDCGGYSGGKSALEHYEDGLFGEPTVTTWTRGEPAEVYWSTNSYHRGGYAYRLCHVPNGQYTKVTEECFQQGHLNFAGKTSWIYWDPWISKPEFFKYGWIPVDLITTKTGTTPEGSEWAKINLPKEPTNGDYWLFKDLVEVPKSLLPGDYVLSFRWDCLSSPQIWSACANIKIQ